MDAVLREELTTLVSSHQFILILLVMPLLVGFLYAAAAGSIVACDGETYYAAVAELDRLLHQSLAKGAAADNHSTVIVLDGSCKYLARTGASLIHQHYQGDGLEGTAPIAAELFTRTLASLCIYNEPTLGQELVGHLDGDVHVAACVAAQIHYQPIHTLDAQFGQSHQHLGISLLAEVLHAYVTRAVIEHI